MATKFQSEKTTTWWPLSCVLQSNNEQFGGHQAFKQKKWLGIFFKFYFHLET